ncbi:MAG: hypothetical protein NC078_06585 [Ruminococcus sp.]|nr:hypothetical protein [Ruminococcus sp.]
MNRNELYRTIIGHDNPFAVSIGKTSVKRAEENKSTKVSEEVKKVLKENAAGKMTDKPTIELTKADMDRLELSPKLIYKSYALGAVPIDGDVLDFTELPFEPSQAIDFMDPHIQGILGEGYNNGLPTTERIAEFYGDMAKRLDEAYSAGKFTKDEFDELNEMILSQVEKEATLTENKTAFYALGKIRYSLPPEAVSEIVQREKLLSPEERLAAREQEIREYAQRHCLIDRAVLMKLFNSVRYGK